MTTELSKVEARQGETLNPMRYVLGRVTLARRHLASSRSLVRARLSGR